MVKLAMVILLLNRVQASGLGVPRKHNFFFRMNQSLAQWPRDGQAYDRWGHPRNAERQTGVPQGGLRLLVDINVKIGFAF